MVTFSRRTTALLSLLCATLGWRSGQAAEPSFLATTAAGVIALNGIETHVALVPAGGTAALRERLAEAGADRRVFLVLRDLHAAAQPGVIYEVYFGLKPDQKAGGAETSAVGSLNFFAVAPPNPGRQISRNYDVTNTIQSLLALGLPPDRLTVTIVTSDGRLPDAAARPTIGSIALVVQ